MRLTDRQVKGIVAGAFEILSQVPGELVLYGSRTDDLLKGGDIDLVFIVENMSPEDEILYNKKNAQVLVAIKKRIGDQRVDFSIISKEKSLSDSFWINALKDSNSLGKN